MVPVPLGDPRARRLCRRVVRDATDELRRRLRVTKLHGGEAEPSGNEMDVGIDEARHDHHAGRVDDPRLGAGELPHLRARADDGEALAGDRERIRPRAPGIAGPHSRVDDGDRRRGRRTRRRRGSIRALTVHDTRKKDRRQSRADGDGREAHG